MITPTPELYNALSTIPVLAGVDAAALTILAEKGVVHEFAPDAWIVREGDRGNSFFILAEGDVDIIKHADQPGAVTLATLHKGNFFGEMCIVEPMPRAASVKTLAPVKVIEIKAGTLYKLFKEMPDQYSIVLLNIARDMARRLRKLDEAYAARAS
jgi:CRP-like cAMP-binding protein